MMTRARHDPRSRQTTHRATRRATRRARPRAFTLVELMISIALVLLLMLGINQVFKVTGEAVGTNQAISTGLRDARAIQSVLTSDFNAWATDVPVANSPPVIIRSERVSAFRNKADEQQDRDWTLPPPTNPDPRLTVDIDGNGQEGESTVAGELTPPAIYNARSHRVDRMMFFGRGLFRRQTGGAVPAPNVYADEYVADMSSSEAWIWLGHLKRPDERTLATPTSNQMFEHRNPGELPDPTGSPPAYNDRNFYASDFVLGRMAMLCATGTDTSVPPDGVDDEIVDRRGIPQHFIRRIDALIPTPTSPTLSPLVQNVQSSEQNATNRWAIQWSRYDVVNTTIAQFKGILTSWLEVNPSVPPINAAAWYNQMADWRFQGDPQPLRPYTTNNAARTTPVLLEHCSQFIVEFTGDFLEQSDGSGTPGNTAPPGTLVDKDGNGTAYGSDGTVDFLIDTSTGTPTRRIRWYGMPRDVAGSPTGGPDGIIRGGNGVADPNQLIDVVPLRDVLGGTFTYTPTMVGAINTEFAERRLPWPSAAPPQRYTDPGTAGMPDDAKYVVAWGPDTVDQPRPKMVRIIVTIDDPDGRIAEGQTFEYVFRVGG